MNKIGLIVILYDGNEMMILRSRKGFFMLKNCTILTFNEMEKLRNNLDGIIEDLTKIANNDCGSISPQIICDYAVNDLKKIKTQLT